MLHLPKYVNTLLETFRKNGFRIYVVGGAVRDLLLLEQNSGASKTYPKIEKGINWDFTTNARPEQILSLFPDGFYNNQFGTVGISQTIQNHSELFEVTTFRKENNYADKRHPDKIEWADSLEQDLARRDFTINAIAYDGKDLIDPFGGQAHLRQKLIVTVGNPDLRFGEDGLRLMRAIRFAAELGFMIEDKTRSAIRKNASLITYVSWERIRDELLKILESGHPSEGILFMRNTGLLSYVLPEVDICFTVPQKSPKRHHIYDVGTHLVMSLKSCPSGDPITRFAALLHDVGKAKTFRKDSKSGIITFYNHEVAGTTIVTAVAERLRLSNSQKEKLIRLVKFHQFTVSELQTDKAIRRFIREVGTQYLRDILDLRTGDRIGSGATPTSWRFELFKKRIEEVQKQPFSVTDLKIDGHDIMKILGLKPGKQIGEILKDLFEKVVAKKIKNTRPSLLKVLKNDGT